MPDKILLTFVQLRAFREQNIFKKEKVEQD